MPLVQLEILKHCMSIFFFPFPFVFPIMWKLLQTINKEEKKKKENKSGSYLFRSLFHLPAHACATKS